MRALSLTNVARASLLALFLLSPSKISAESDPKLDPGTLARFPPKSPAEATATFQLKPGFKIELAASEPLTEDPIAISFDEHGRLFTCEMRGYSERRDEARGRIRMLTDDDGDGRYDRATTYADNLKWPTALICWDGGVFVGATPDIWYFKDTTGDGLADIKKRVFTGFAKDVPRLNVQGLMNSFAWGPDHRIYGATAHHGGQITHPDVADDKPVNLRGRDFSFDPTQLDLRPESGTAQYGLTFDDDGTRYVCSNSSHVEAVIYSWPHVGANLPNALLKIPTDGAAAEVFRTSPVEPWRIVRTRWRVQGKVGGPVEGGGRAAGYFTSASGLCAYRGHAFPEEYGGNIFVGDVGSNLVHRKIVIKSKDRIHLSASRPEDEQNTEFLTSTDTWFRPVQCQNGPGGALYIVDMYREIIEHPWSFPPEIKSQLDLNSGHDRGRIWRILPDEPTKNVKAPPAASRDRRPELWALASGGNLSSQTLISALSHPDATVRQTAIRLANNHPVPPTALQPAASDKNPWVRFELALYLTKPQNKISDPTTALLSLAKHSKGDAWIEAAIAEAAAKRSLIGELFAPLLASDPSISFLKKLAEKSAAADTPSIVSSLAATADLGQASEVIRLLPHRPKSEAIQPLLKLANASSSPHAIPLLSLDPEISDDRFWQEILANSPAAAAALEALKSRSPDWKSQALARWQKLPASARAYVLKSLSPTELLAAVESKNLTASEVPFPVQTALRNHSDAAVKKRSLAAFGAGEVRTREEIAKHFRPALELEGEATRGEEIFTVRCHLCHEAHGSKEQNAGPPLTTFQNKGAPLLLENLIAPDTEFAPQFSAWKLETTDGESHLGLLGRETAEAVTLILPGRIEKKIPRDQIRSLANQNRSLMPAGLESGLTLQQMADLLAFLTEVRVSP